MKEEQKEKIIAKFEFELNNIKSVFNNLDIEVRKKILMKIRNALRNTLNWGEL